MKKVLLFSILICLFLIQGCGQWISIIPDHPPQTTSSVQQTEDVSYEKNYKIGEKKSAFIGQEIIRVKQYNHIQKYVLKHSEFIKGITAPKDIIIDARYKFHNYQIKIEANKKYQSNDTISTGGEIYYLINLLDKDNMPWGVLISCDGVIYTKAIYSYYDRLLFYPQIITFTPSSLNDKFIAEKEIKDIKETQDKNVKPGIMYELIYSGKNDVSLNATYREYSSDDLARQAFFQNLTYQANAKQIRFKDFVIQIHNVTNEQITYTILEDGLK